MRKLAIPLAVRWLAPIVEDKDRMEAILQASDVEWIAPRFPAIIDGPAKPFRTSADGRRIRFTITTGSCATFMLDQLADSPYLRAAPSVSN